LLVEEEGPLARAFPFELIVDEHELRPVSDRTSVGD